MKVSAFVLGYPKYGANSGVLSFAFLYPRSYKPECELYTTNIEFIQLFNKSCCPAHAHCERERYTAHTHGERELYIPTRDPIKNDEKNNNVGIKKKSTYHTSSPSFLSFPFQCYLDLSVMLLIIEYVLDLSLIETYTERVFLQLKLH